MSNISPDTQIILDAFQSLQSHMDARMDELKADIKAVRQEARAARQEAAKAKALAAEAAACAGALFDQLANDVEKLKHA